MPATKKTRTKKRAPRTPRARVNAERRAELAEEFIQYAELREQVEEKLKAARTSGDRSLFLHLRDLLDLSADAAERVDGYSLNEATDEATGELASFLR